MQMQMLKDVDPSGRTSGCAKKPGFAECPGTNRFQFELVHGDEGLGGITVDNSTLGLLAIIVAIWYWFKQPKSRRKKAKA